MRCKLIILLCSVGTLAALPSSSQKPKLDISYDRVALSTVLEDIKSRTGYRFLYFIDEIPSGATVTINRTGASVEEVLDAALKENGLTYTMDEDVIVIRTAETKDQAVQQPLHIVITGVVRDASGIPLPGVAVTVKGTTTGLVTDIEGRYSITLRDNNRTLNFSYLGKIPVEITYTGQNVIDVRMEDDLADIDQVVITGYYSQSAATYTGSSSSFSSAELQSAGTVNVMKSLSNLDPSFRMVENKVAGSNPNVIPDFQMRGQSTISAFQQDNYVDNSNMPLFILDGFETTAETIFDLDIYRIERVTLLKDASATAIYGSRGANGVVVVTTFAPKEGKLTLRYNADLTFSVADLSDYNLMNSSEKLQAETEAGMYSYWIYRSLATPNARERVYGEYTRRLNDVLRGVDTYWLDKPLDSVTVGHRHKINVEGGNEKLRFSVDAMYYNQPGVMKESSRDRNKLDVQLMYVHKNLRFTNRTSFGRVQEKNSPYGSFNSYAAMNPYLRYKDENGRYIGLVEEDKRLSTTRYVYSPLYNSTLNTKDQSRYTEFINNFGVIWDITSELSLRGDLAISERSSTSDVFKPASHTDFAQWTGDRYNRRGSYVYGSGRRSTYDGKVVGIYQKNFNDHNLTSRLVYEIQQQKSIANSFRMEGFPHESLDDLGFAAQYAENTVPSSTNYTARLMSFAANVNYSYMNKYMADVSFRYDASSRFGSDRRWAPFWSAGIGWNIAREAFLRDVEFVNLLKIRFSTGETGSVNYDPSQALSTYQYLTGTRYLYNQGTLIKSFGNTDLGWQKTFTNNLGIDTEFWDRRLTLRGDYYIKTTNDMILDVSTAPSTGFSSYKANLGKVENKGFEVYLKIEPYRNLQKGIVLGFTASAVTNKNTLKKISNGLASYNDSVYSGYDSDRAADTDGNRYNIPRANYIEGESINIQIVNHSLGIDPATGRELFLSRNGSIVSEWSAANNTYVVNLDPKIYGTFGFYFIWNKFQLNTIFRYSHGADIYNYTLVNKVQDADLRNNVDKRFYTDRWKEPGDISRFTAITEANGVTGGSQSTRPTSRFVEKENYLELGSLTASYDFEGPRMRRIGLQRIRVNFNMDDVFRASTVKIERGTAYPFARSFTIGMQATF